ncbi:MAG: NeuD/PglB/VioB family sugar acetyltransferase, partial [Thermoleophilia bacterium]|nr:NeuD/PglB/VioB family sugar acetyltransferase [Thermoleophilia bacterium]
AGALLRRLRGRGRLMAQAPRVVARIVAPLVNTNEPEAQVIELPARPFAPIAAGEVVCVLETSKSTEEVVSEHDGWLGALHVGLYDRIAAGDPICEVYDAEPPREAPAAAAAAGGEPLRLTRKAEAMAREAGVDLSGLPTDRFITERDIRELIARQAPPAELPAGVRERIGPASVVVFGGGGLGKSLVDAMRARGELEPLCVVDDGMVAGEEVLLGLPVVGGRAQLRALADAGARLAVNGVGAIGRMRARIEVSGWIEEAGLEPVTVVDPSAAVAASARLEPGAQVFPCAVVWSEAVIGRGTIVNTGAIVSHDCRVGEHCHLAPGAILAGDVTVGEGTLVGMGVTVALGLRVGARAIVGNGAVVTADVPDDAIVPAGATWGSPGDRPRGSSSA